MKMYLIALMDLKLLYASSWKINYFYTKFYRLLIYIFFAGLKQRGSTESPRASKFLRQTHK